MPSWGESVARLGADGIDLVLGHSGADSWITYKVIKHFVVWNLPAVRKAREEKAARNKVYAAYRDELLVLQEKYRYLKGVAEWQDENKAAVKERDRAFEDLKSKYGTDVIRRGWE